MGRLDFVIRQRTLYPQLTKYRIRTKMPDWIYGSTVIDIHEGVYFSDQGFGFQWDETEFLRIPHLGHIKIGNKVEIFSGTNIVRPTVEDTYIGDGTKIDYDCHIAHNVNIGKHCLIIAGTKLGGSVRIGDYCYLGIGAIIRNKAKIGRNVLVGMGSNVVSDIPDNAVVYGNPAKIVKYQEGLFSELK